MITLSNRRVRPFLIKWTVILLLVCVFARRISAETTNEAPTTSIPKSYWLRERPVRLPNDTYPLSYRLHITSNIHLGEEFFSGNVTIDIEIRQSTNEIVLHAKKLKDFQITVHALDSIELADELTHTYDSERFFLIIHPRENYQAFEAGQRYRVQILYSAEMQAQTIGLYSMIYKEEKTNRSVYAAATQSEPTYARLVFPCYDEPAFKSNFTIIVTHSKQYSAISNMPVKQVERHGDSNELSTTTFLSTPPMSTYLVAFVISDFEHISSAYRGVTHRIFTSPQTNDKGEYALKNSIRILTAFEDYFGISYPLEKLDHVALSKNYGAAMENWGLITYKENSLVNQDFNDVHRTLKDLLTQSHEIAHQWFGNLVSPEWWTYAWMNEGFATYFSYVIADLLYPKDKVMEFFIWETAERAYSYNYISVRPMTHYVEDEDAIMGVFDIISYQRAACVIKMFHHAFRPKTFVLGIRNFLQNFQYTVANELMLFDSLQAALLDDKHFEGQSWLHSVRSIMLSWTHSEWIPIVTVTRNYENDTITFTQRSKDSKEEYWWIPLNFATTQSSDFQQTHVELFMPPQHQLTLSLSELGLQLSGREWLIVNKQQTGFYHVLYDVDNLRAIGRQLQHNHTVIHPMNRAAIFQDLRPLIEHNEFESVEVIFELLKYLRFEEDLIPWNLVSDTIEFLDYILYNTESREKYKEFVRRLVAPTFQRLFQTSNSDNRHTNSDLLVGQKILEIACTANLPECQEYTQRLAHDYIFNNKDLENESEYYATYDTILCLGMRYLSDEEFNDVLKILQESIRRSVHLDDILYSLRCTQNRLHLRKYLNILINQNVTKLLMDENEALMYLFYVFKSNTAAQLEMWNFLDENYKSLCGLTLFVDHFNRIAEYTTEHQRYSFYSLRQKIYEELRSMHPSEVSLLISKDSNRVGKKVRVTEQFLQKFERRIYNWLHHELPNISSARLSLRNSSSRPGGLLRSAAKFLRNLA